MIPWSEPSLPGDSREEGALLAFALGYAILEQDNPDTTGVVMRFKGRKQAKAERSARLNGLIDQAMAEGKFTIQIQENIDTAGFNMTGLLKYRWSVTEEGKNFGAPVKSGYQFSVAAATLEAKHAIGKMLLEREQMAARRDVLAAEAVLGHKPDSGIH